MRSSSVLTEVEITQALQSLQTLRQLLSPSDLLEINDVTDSNIMWDALNAGTAEMWAAAWQATVDPDMYRFYHSASVKSNYYHQ